MPIYEYRCASCGAELEKLQKISDPPLLECPECGRDALVKLISASSFRLKGSGWYETDFKTGNKKNGAAEAPSEGAGNADTAGAATTATTPESADKGSKTAGKDLGQDSPSKDSKGKDDKGKDQQKAEPKTATKPDKSGIERTSGAAGTRNKPAAKP